MSQAYLVPALDFNQSTPVTPWNPGDISNLIQRFLDENPGYGGTLESIPYITPEEPGTVAVPQPGACWDFDGSNDFAVTSSPLATGTTPTIAFWMKPADVESSGRPVATRDESGNGIDLYLEGGKLKYYNIVIGAGTIVSNTTFSTGIWYHIAVVFTGSQIKFYVNGALDFTGTGAMIQGASNLYIGKWSGGGNYSGSLKGVLIGNTAWAPTEIAYLHANHELPSTIDISNVLAWYQCEERKGGNGAKGYNCLVDANHLTFANITESTFHATDAAIKYSHSNEKGYTLANNLLTYSGDFSNAIWSAYLGSKTPGTTDPSGGTAGVSVTYVTDSDSDLANNTGSLSSTTYTLSVYARSATSKSFRFAYFSSGWNHSSNIATTPTWTRYSFTFTNGLQAIRFANSLPGASGVIEFAFPQLEVGSVATPYAATNASTLNGVMIPAQLTDPTKDAAGNALGVTGPVCYPATVEVPCVTGDGNAVYAVSGNNIGISGAGSYTIAWRGIMPTVSTSFHTFVATGTTSANNAVAFCVDVSNKWNCDLYGGASFSFGTNDQQWHHHAVSYDGSKFRWYIDGVLSYTSAIITMATTNSPFRLLSRPGGGFWGALSICDVRVYSDVKTLAEIQAIQSGTTDNRTNLVAHWPCAEGNSRKIYDTVGTNHLTIVNGTVETIRGQRCPYVREPSILYGGSYNPNMLSYSNDFTNAAWYKDGATPTPNDTIAPDGSTTATKIVFSGSAKVLQQFTTIPSQVLTFSVWIKGTAGETISFSNFVNASIVHTLDGTWQRLTFTSTVANPAVTITTYDGATARTIWIWRSQLEPGSVATPYQANATTPSNEFVVGRIGSNLDAAGNPKTLAAGKFGNSYARLVPNYKNAPKLTIRGVDISDKLTPSTTYDSVTTANDDAFNRIKADGSDRYFLTEASLTGDDLTNADEYTS